MGELFDKEVNAQKESLKKLQGFTQAPRASPRKVCDENETNKETNKEIRKKKRRARKNVIDGRKHYIERLQKTGEKD